MQEGISRRVGSIARALRRGQWDRLHCLQLAGEFPRQGGLLPGPFQVADAADRISGEQMEHVGQRSGFHACRSAVSVAASPARAAAVARRSRVRRWPSSSLPSGGTILLA
jgi:hypothetical protein